MEQGIPFLSPSNFRREDNHRESAEGSRNADETINGQRRQNEFGNKRLPTRKSRPSLEPGPGLGPLFVQPLTTFDSGSNKPLFLLL